MSKHLYCHTTLIHNDGDVCALQGHMYDIINDDEFAYEIINELGNEHSLTKEQDDNGDSFLSWFNVIDE